MVNTLCILAAYALVMIGATLFFTQRARTKEGYHVANRSVGTIMGGFSVASAWIWAPSLFVSAERAYVTGIPGMFWFLVPNVLCLLVFIPFAKRARHEFPKGMTLSGYMGRKYKSEKVKKIYLFQLGSLAVFSAAVQLLAGSKILSLITGLPFWLLTVVFAAIAFSYSQFSGIKASVTTDLLQMGVIFAGLALLLPWALHSSGGISTLLQGLSGHTGEYTGLWNAKGAEVFFAFGLSTAIGLMSGPFGDQSFWQRSFAIKEKSIGKAFALGAFLFALVPIAMGSIGYLAAGSGFKASDTGVVNFEFISSLLPKWVLAPFVIMILAGLLSTVSSNLCSAASLTTDRRKTESGAQNIRSSKITMALLLLLAVGIANVPGLTVTHLFLFYGTLRASTLLPTVLTLKGRKLSENGVFYGILASLAIGLPIFAYGNIANISLYKIIGSITAVLLSGIVALTLTGLEVRRHAR